MREVPTKIDLQKNKLAAVDALWLVARLGQEFPGLLDGETDVDGGDLVDWLSMQINNMSPLREWMNVYRVEDGSECK